MQYISKALHPAPVTKPHVDEHGVPVARTVLITGATSGIGKGFADLFARDGYHIVAVARDENKLQEAIKRLEALGSPKVVSIPCDLAKLDAPKQVFDELTKRNIHIDILVNNAGHGRIEKVEEQTVESIQKINLLNVNTPTILTRLLLPGMREKKYGKILNVASIVAFVAHPNQNVYAASKAYLLSFSNALSEELKDSGISVTAVCPGITATEFFDRAGSSNEKVEKIPVAMKPEDVAKEGYHALFRGEQQYICGFRNYGITKLGGILPSALTNPILAKFGESMQSK